MQNFEQMVMLEMKKLIRLGIIAFIGLTFFGPGMALAEGDRFAFITHASDSDPWWNTIKNAIKHAEADLNVKVDYRSPPNGDLADMARLVEQAAARNYDGVIVTIADFNVLKKAIQKVTRKGIPVITVNSGTHEESRKLGAKMHIGQPEYDAGFGAGLKAKNEAGIKSFLCVNHYTTDPGSFERCRGFADGLGIDFKNSTIDSGNDPTVIESKVRAYLRKNPETEAILTLGPTSAHPTLRYLKKAKKSGEIYFVTFDLSQEIVKAIDAGAIAFAIDQQPYLQGYLSTLALTLYTRYGLMPANNVNSGPSFVTKSNLAVVEKYAGEYR